MKFDREIIIGIIVCAVILFGWGPFARKMGWLPSENAPAAAQTAVTPESAPTTTPAPEQASAPAQVAVVQPAAAPTPAAAPQQQPAPTPAVKIDIPQAPTLADVELTNPDLKVMIDPNSGAATAFQLEKYKQSVPLEKPEGFFQVARHPELKTPVTFATRALNLVFKNADQWRVAKTTILKNNGRTLALSRKIVNISTGAELTVKQSWSLNDAGYKIDYQVAIVNSGKAPLILPEMEIDGGTISSSQQLSGDAVRGDSHYLDYMTAAGDYSEIAADKKDEKFQAADQTPVRWAALSNKYFCTILKSGRDREAFKLVTGRSGEIKNANSISLAVGMAVPVRELHAEEEVQYAFDYYCGPKILGNLTDFDQSTAKIMHLSWGPLNYLARAMLWFLVKLNTVIGSYGVCIIILTLLVRLIFYPITARGNASMKKMQAVQPKIKELREKYKDNPQLMNSKMMELYRTEGINPFGGCLPILLQIPVFFALYSTFNGAVELRQSSFLWCRNLAAADTVAYIFSLPINPLVLIMTALMVLQQYLTPMSMEPAQRKMMLAMPIIMLFFFYDLPSGLTLYWTVSNIFSIIQLRMQQRGSKITEAAGAAKN